MRSSAFLAQPDATAAFGTWDATNSSAAISVPYDIPAGTDVTFVIPDTSGCAIFGGGAEGRGLTLPAQGVVRNESAFTLSARVEDGVVPAVSIADSPSIGMFFTQPVVGYCQAGGCDAGGRADVRLDFSINGEVAWVITANEANVTTTINVTETESYNVTVESVYEANVTVVINVSTTVNMTRFENVTVLVITPDICFGPNISDQQNVTELTYSLNPHPNPETVNPQPSALNPKYQFKIDELEVFDTKLVYKPIILKSSVPKIVTVCNLEPQTLDQALHGGGDHVCARRLHRAAELDSVPRPAPQTLPHCHTGLLERPPPTP